MKGCRKNSILILLRTFSIEPILCRSRHSRGAIALSLTLLSGCYPHPHDYVLTQEFTGVLLESGNPMPGVAVTVSHSRGDSGDYCERPEVVATTDDAGRFHVPAKVQRRLFESLINPPNMVSQTMAICFRAAGESKLGALVNSPTDRQMSYSAICAWHSSGSGFEQNTVLSAHESGICTRDDSS
jgi:hypothetical protein